MFPTKRNTKPDATVLVCVAVSVRQMQCKVRQGYANAFSIVDRFFFFTFEAVHIIGFKYSKLKFDIIISTVEISKHNYASLHLAMSTIKRTDRNPSRRDSFLKTKRIQSPVSIGVGKPFSAEELPETTVKV